MAVGTHVRVQEACNLAGPLLRVDLGQAAELLARAGLQAALEEVGIRRELLVDRLGEQRLDEGVRDPGDQDVLLVGQPQLAPPSAVRMSQPPELAQLARPQPPDRDHEAHGGMLAIGLRRHADVVMPLEVGLGRRRAAQL